MNPRVVCFDIGGVLAQIIKTWDDALILAGVTSTSGNRLEIFWKFPGLNPYQAGDISFDQYLIQLAAYLQLADSEEARLVHNAILVREFPGVLDLGKDLRSDGILTACMSNTNAPHMDVMLHSGRFPSIEALDLRVTSHDAGVNKPDPALYLAFEKRSGFKGDDIHYFDDIQANIDTALSLGWRGTVIDPARDTAGQMRTALLAQGWRKIRT